MLVEARLGWGSEVLAVAHVRARKTLRLADFGLPFPEDASVALAELPRSFTSGASTLFLELVDDEKRIPAAKSDGRVAKGIALGFVIHAALLAIAYLGRGSDADLERAQLEDLKTLLDAQEERLGVLKVHAQTYDELFGDSLGETGGLAEGGEQGAMGNPASQQNQGAAQKARGVHTHANDPRPEPGVESFGMIALLSENGLGQSAGNDAFATHEGPSAMGSIFGTHIDDAIGVGGMGLSGFGEAGGGGGLGLSGIGESGGGKGEGIMLGGIGTLGFGACGCGASGFGKSGGRLGGGHQVRSPVLRCGHTDAEGDHVGCDVQVNGRLPPEAVQRVVRQNFGRLRSCYEAGLRRDPSLEGRIAVKFVIDRSGAVTMASAAERDLPDAEVARCVAHGFENMSFPEPEGGIVTVVYPVVFSLM